MSDTDIGDEVETDPSKTELEELRAEKKAREQAERDAKDAELEELRAFKNSQAERDAKKVKAPTPKSEKEPVTVEKETVTEKPTSDAHGGSRRWFGN